MKRIAATVALGMLFLSSTGIAAGAAEDKKARPDPDEVICKIEDQTNTRFKKKVCMTRRDREALAEAQKRDLAEMVSRSVMRDPDE
ncbi:hypothetical protein [Sphingosinicella xenopeptidilytica]|uniref:Uncharacterized protein n=1 Tax=Sphingosinicella xenopeptidilytica TaxID=364098 RepID=A0ABW3BZX6_SPHXN